MSVSIVVQSWIRASVVAHALILMLIGTGEFALCNRPTSWWSVFVMLLFLLWYVNFTLCLSLYMITFASRYLFLDFSSSMILSDFSSMSC